MTEKAIRTIQYTAVVQKLVDYIQLGKLRLSILVVLSAGLSYLIALKIPFTWSPFVSLLLGGLLVSLSANSINEILEWKWDALMYRTSQRPIPALRMSRYEAIIYALVNAILGIGILALGVNVYAAMIGALSLVLYAFVYTPMKRYSSLSVFIGAIPGALPTIIGWVGAAERFEAGTWVLFLLQFLWQLPHFWSIAWLAYEDYQKAGYQLMPLGGGLDRISALQITLYSMLLLPASLAPFWYQMIPLSAALVLLLGSILFVIPTLYLFLTLKRKAAVMTMFGSFLYLPFIQITILLTKY